MMLRRPSLARLLLTTGAFLATTMTTTKTTTTHGYPFELDFSVLRNDQTPRVLQTSGGRLPDLGAPEDSCDALGGTRFFCDIFQKVGYESDYMSLNISIQCFLDATTEFDFRRAAGCTCTTLLTPSNASRLPKTCPCYVCPRDFGSSSVSIDCSHLIPNATDSNSTNSTSVVPSEMPSSVPSASPGEGGGGGASPPTAAPSVPKGTSTTSAPVVGGGQGIPVQPTNAPVTAATTTPTTNPTEVPAVATAGVTPVPTLAPQPMQQRDRKLQGATNTAAPSPSAQLVAGNSTNSTNSTNATVLPDPYIFDTCVSVDCGGNCNGSCSLGCDDPTAATLCDFCEGAEGSPTPGPTGSGSGAGPKGGTDNVPTIGGATSGAPPHPAIGRSGNVVAAVCVGWAVVVLISAGL